MRQVGDLFTGVLAAAGDDPEVQLILLRELWPLVVGRNVAENIRPVGLAGGTLTVASTDPVWAAQLRGLDAMLVGAVNRFWGRRVVERIRVGGHPR